MCIRRTRVNELPPGALLCTAAAGPRPKPIAPGVSYDDHNNDAVVLDEMYDRRIGLHFEPRFPVGFLQSNKLYKH